MNTIAIAKPKHNRRTFAMIIIAKWFCAVDTAQNKGGVWFCNDGGTADVACGLISRATGMAFEDVHQMMHQFGCEIYNEYWYSFLSDGSYVDYPNRWSITTVTNVVISECGLKPVLACNPRLPA